MRKLMILLLAFVIGVGLLGWHLMFGFGGGNDRAEAKDDDTSSKAEVATCLADYRQEDITDPKLHRYKEGGVDAKTAAKSSEEILAVGGHDASTLREYAATTFGLPNVPAVEDLLTEDETCLSEAGIETYDRLADIMAASGKTFDDAPAWAYNSGVDDEGNPVIAAEPGISGNRKAVKFTLPNGTVAYILVRCGNPVYPSQPPGIPEGPTDNPPDDNPPDDDEKKDPWNDPYPQGNAPEGGGRNEDPGPGTYIPPGDMETPGPTPYTPPASPTPTPGGGNSGSGGNTPTPDPTFTPPPPEPSAPPTNNPETGCTPIPGVEDCK